MADPPGLLGNLFPGNDPAALYQGLLSDPATQQQMNQRALAAMAGSFAESAMPTRMPTPFGAVLGRAAAAGATSGDAVMQARLQAAQAQQEQALASLTTQKAGFMKDLPGLLQGYYSLPGTMAAPGAPSAGGATGGPVGPSVGSNSAGTQQILAQYGDLINKAATTHGVDPNLIAAVINTESGGNPNSVNKVSGASGLGNLMPDTAKELGVKNIFDPEENINGVAKYLKQGLDKYNGDTTQALKYYYGGPNEKAWASQTANYPNLVYARMPTAVVDKGQLTKVTAATPLTATDATAGPTGLLTPTPPQTPSEAATRYPAPIGPSGQTTAQLAASLYPNAPAGPTSGPRLPAGGLLTPGAVPSNVQYGGVPQPQPGTFRMSPAPVQEPGTQGPPTPTGGPPPVGPTAQAAPPTVGLPQPLVPSPGPAPTTPPITQPQVAAAPPQAAPPAAVSGTIPGAPSPQRIAQAQQVAAYMTMMGIPVPPDIAETAKFGMIQPAAQAAAAGKALGELPTQMTLEQFKAQQNAQWQLFVKQHEPVLTRPNSLQIDQTTGRVIGNYEALGPDGNMHRYLMTPQSPQPQDLGQTQVGPYATAGQQEVARKNQEDAATVNKNAAAASQAQTQATNMRQEAKSFYTGPGAEYNQALNRILVAIHPDDPDRANKVASYETFIKDAGLYARQQAQAASARAGVQELKFVASSTPSEETTPRGLDRVLSQIQGISDYQLAKQQAMNAYVNQPGRGGWDNNGFEAQFNSTVSPYAFMYMRYSDQDRAEMVQKLSQTKEGQADLRRLQSQIKYITDNNLVIR